MYIFIRCIKTENIKCDIVKTYCCLNEITGITSLWLVSSALQDCIYLIKNSEILLQYEMIM